MDARLKACISQRTLNSGSETFLYVWLVMEPIVRATHDISRRYRVDEFMLREVLLATPKAMYEDPDETRHLPQRLVDPIGSRTWHLSTW
jgi:hypothetical protein